MDNIIKNLVIIGTGPCSNKYLFPEAMRAIKEADVLAGSEKILSWFSDLGKNTLIYKGDFESWIIEVKKLLEKMKVAVLVSGDPGFFSLADKILDYFKPNIPFIIPNVSSLQLASARGGFSWANLKVKSLHGRDKNLLFTLDDLDKFAVLIDKKITGTKIYKCLKKLNHNDREIQIFSNLGSENEKILKLNSSELLNIDIFPNSIIIFSEMRTLPKKFYGIGVGIGGENMLVRKALQVIKRADVVVIPRAKGSIESKAIINLQNEADFRGKIEEVVFNMSTDKKVLMDFYENLSIKIYKLIQKGLKVAYLTIGDPVIYSTYCYLLYFMKSKLPNKEIETIPGINSFSFAAANLNETLLCGNEKMAILPCNKTEGYEKILNCFDTVILMKIGKNLKKVIKIIKDANRTEEALVFSNMGLLNEEIGVPLDKVDENSNGYFTTIIIKRKRNW